MDELSSLHHTLLTLLPPRSLSDFTSHWVHRTWLGLMPPAGWTGLLSLPPPPPNRGPCLLPTFHTLCQTHWMCISAMIPSGHMTSIVLSILERDPPLLLSWRFLPFFPCEKVFSIFWELFPVQCEVKGQGCGMCTDCKALWGTFVICENGLYTIKRNWIESSQHFCKYSFYMLRLGFSDIDKRLTKKVNKRIKCNK